MLIFRKIAKGAGIFLAVLVIWVIALYLEEDWRGARDWAACQRELAAKGEILDLRTLAPPGDPKDDLSKAPIFAEVYREQALNDGKSLSDLEPSRLRTVDVDFHSGQPSPKWGDFHRGEPLDLKEWQEFYRAEPKAHLPAAEGTPAQDVLVALRQFDPIISEVDAAVSRPGSFFPIDYEAPFLSKLLPVTDLIKVAKFLRLRAVAELENGEADLAEKDFLFSVRLNQPLGKNCFLIDELVVIADRSLDDGILWEGIHGHKWTDTQLREMDSALGSGDFLSLGQKTFRFERASMLQTSRVMEHTDLKSFMLMESLYEWGIWHLLHARPAGWWQQDRISYCQRLQTWIEEIRPDSGILNIPHEVEPEADGFWKRASDLLFRPLSSVALPAVVGVLSKIAEAETNNREARLACRLEEYYLAHKAYPDRLDALGALPAHLNQEVLSEKPLHYYRQGDSYVLYSPGWDGKDRGGTPRAQGQSGEDFDWVWPGP